MVGRLNGWMVELVEIVKLLIELVRWLIGLYVSVTLSRCLLALQEHHFQTSK